MKINQLKHSLHTLKMYFYDIEIKLFGAWNFFLKLQKKEENRLIKTYYNHINNIQTIPSYIIFTCNGYTWHGGLADRIKGIVSIYEWCINNDKEFRINFNHPFCLQDYLIPNKYNWLIDTSKVSYSYHDAEPKVCLLEPRTCHKKEVLDNQRLLLTQWCNNSLNNNKQIHVYTNMDRLLNNFSILFNELFKPSKRLQSEIDKNLKELGNKYISISFRFTTIMGDFTDCAGEEYSEENKVQLLKNCVQAVKDIRKNAPLHDKVLITADSIRFLDYAKDNLNDIYIIPGKVGHIDYNSSDDVNMKTFLDFILISKAEKVYLVRNKDMYKSNFAKAAAMVNNKKFEMINI